MNTTMETSYESLYLPNMMEMRVTLYLNEIGGNKTKENLRKMIAHQIEGKCVSEGYVRPTSVNVKSYNNGVIKGEKIEFLVVFQCLICNPAEGTWIENCKVSSKTKAGIHANIRDGTITPVTVFVIRDHYIDNQLYELVKEQDYINIKVIGTRYELNDECVEVLGQLVPRRNTTETKEDDNDLISRV